MEDKSVELCQLTLKWYPRQACLRIYVSIARLNWHRGEKVRCKSDNKEIGQRAKDGPKTPTLTVSHKAEHLQMPLRISISDTAWWFLAENVLWRL